MRFSYSQHEEAKWGGLCRKSIAPPSGSCLDEEGAAIFEGMLVGGERQHDIAAWFGLNGGHFKEISTSANFAEVKSSKSKDLPPQRPYLSKRQSAERLAKRGFSYLAE